MIGGFHRAKSLRPRGASSVAITSTSRPVSRAASSPGLPIVALARHQRGSPPCSAISRRKPAQHHRDLRPEDAAQHVRLVDHDDRQPEQEVGPPRVIGQQRQVQHVGVREHQVRVLADQRALALRGIAVVDRRAHLRQLERAHRAQLVARQRLRREQEQRRRLRRGERGLGGRDLIDERLAARGAGGEHDVASGAHRLEPRGLMRVEPRDAEQPEPRDEHLGQALGERQHRRRVGGQVAHVHEALGRSRVGGQPVEERLRLHAPRLRGGAAVGLDHLAVRRPEPVTQQRPELRPVRHQQPHARAQIRRPR